MTYAYLRVSSDRQDEENQRLGVDDLAKKKGLVIDEYVRDHGKSGTIVYTERNLKEIIDKMKKGDVIIISELSRLSRKMYEIFDILQIVSQKGVSLYTVKEHFELKDDIQSKVMAFAFGLSAEIERNMISERTKEALARLKAEGKHIGREMGVRSRLNPVCVKNHSFILNELNNGVSIPDIAKKIKVARGTLYRYLAYTEIRLPVKTNNGRWERGIY